MTLFSLVSLGNLCAQESAGKTPKLVNAESKSADFLRKVQPIFQKHCVSCHGPDDQRNGLRLDLLMGAVRGGDTGRPILGGTLETNEVYRRVNSTDPTYRMPKGSEPLSQPEIEAIRQWVLMDCPWPDDSFLKTAQGAEARSWWPPRFALSLLDGAAASEIWLKRNPYYSEFRWITLAVLMLTLVIEQIRKRARSGKPLRRWISPLSWITTGQILCGWGLLAATFVMLQLRGHRDEALRDAVMLRGKLTALEMQTSQSTDVRNLFGDPPTPTRLTHPKALRRSYYRGNCERNDLLFNHGNYCTATFEVSLQTAGGVPLEYGAPIPDEELVIHFELKRSPGATPELYAADMMSGVFLSEAAKLGNKAGQEALSVPLQTLKKDWEWGCDFPVTKTVAEGGWRSGLIYLYKGRSGEPGLSGEMHYAIKYEICEYADRIHRDSDIWMGCLLMSAVVQRPAPKGQLPFCEWFDWRPIPEITGTNSTDPKLLGIPEHRPEYEATADDAAQPPAPEPLKPPAQKSPK